MCLDVTESIISSIETEIGSDLPFLCFYKFNYFTTSIGVGITLLAFPNWDPCVLCVCALLFGVLCFFPPFFLVFFFLFFLLLLPFLFFF